MSFFKLSLEEMLVLGVPYSSYSQVKAGKHVKK